MTRRIQGRGGESLADVYDVRGSDVQLENLLDQDVQLVHELGALIFSERYSCEIRRIESIAIAASTAFDSVAADFPNPFFHVIGAIINLDGVLADYSALPALMVRSAQNGREIPILQIEAGSTAQTIRMDRDGSGASSSVGLFPTIFNRFPFTVANTDQPQDTGAIALRGATAAFGAGTRNVRANILIAFPQIGGISSRGLPLPSW